MSLHDEILNEISEIMFEDKDTSLKIHFLVKEIRVHPDTYKELLKELYEEKTGELKLFGFPLIIDESIGDWMVVTK